MAANSLKQIQVEKLTAVGEGTSAKLWLVANMGKDTATVLSTRSEIRSLLLNARDDTLTLEEQLTVSEHLDEITDEVSAIFEYIYVIDNQGIVIASSDQNTIGKDDSDRDVIAHQQRRSYIGKPYVGVGGTPRIPYARPVFDENGEQIGLVYIAISLPGIEKHVFAMPDLGKNALSFLIDTDGTILSGVNGDYSVFLTEKFDLSIFPDGENLVVAPGYLGEMEYVLKFSIPGTNWLVITTETVHAINDPIMSLVTSMLVISTIVIIAGIFMAGFVANQISRPIEVLKESAEQLALGDIDTAVTHVDLDEIGQLADSFRYMIKGKKQRVNFVTKLASGNINFKVIAASEKDVENHTLIRMKITLSAMVAALEELTHQAAEGNLSYRVDAEQFQGVYHEQLEKLNQAFDLIINPLQESIRLSVSYSNGDYSDRFDPNITVKGDFIPFKTALDQIGINSSDALLKIRAGIHDIGVGTSEASNSIEDIATSVVALTEISSHVSSLVDQNDISLEQALKAIEDLACTVREVVQHTDYVYEIATQSSDLASDGVRRAELAGKGMEQIMESFMQTSKTVSTISEQIDEIGEIVEMIAGIAEQTGLIALNAAIEAACAGEAGLGFGFVSDEVKALALESHRSAEHIGTIINNLQEMSLEMALSMEKTSGVVQSGSNAVNETVSIFYKMAESISNVNQKMSEVTAVSEEQAASAQEIAASMSSVRDMVQDTAKEATDSAAAAEEISASLDQLKHTSVQFAQLAKYIEKQADLFKID
jgi:methyl-accepting chemotaxis protein